jgi:positive phototaxis protein PixI
MTTATSTKHNTATQYISFILSEQVRGMLPTTELTETINLELGNIVQIPDLHPAVVGACGWRGDVLWLVDLSYALALPPLLGSDYQPSKCSVLRVTVNQQTFGLLVAEVRQLIRCDRQDILPGISPAIKTTVSHLISGQFTSSQGETLLSINLEAILDMLRQQG